MISDVLLLSYLDKIGLSLTDEAGQASAYLYSEARLYKGASLAPLSQSTTTRSTGNISVGVKKVDHSNTRGTVSSLFFSAQTRSVWQAYRSTSKHLRVRYGYCGRSVEYAIH